MDDPKYDNVGPAVDELHDAAATLEKAAGYITDAYPSVAMRLRALAEECWGNASFIEHDASFVELTED